MLSVKLNGFEFENPVGLDSLNERIFFNEELSMYLNQLDGEITFVGGGYNYLREQFNTGVCNNVDVEILDSQMNEVYVGAIFLNDIEWNLSKRLAKVNIVSDKYIELIDSNKGIKVQLGVNRTKDQEGFSVGVPVTISVPNPDSTVFVNRIGFRLFDVFDALVRFMSNDELTFVSDYFDPSNGELASYDVLFSGEEFRTGSGDTTSLISYQDFFSDMNKLHNLAGRVEGDTLRIEPKSYFRNNEISTSISNVNEFTQSLNREQFYASIKMGSAKVADGYGYLIRLSYNGFQKEQFFLQGQCNIYNELDLELKTLITDTNVIQDMLPVSSGGSDNSEFDDDIILLHCSQANAPYLTLAPLSATNYYMNDYYTNRQVSERWAETYPFSIIQLLETENPLVFAKLTADQTISTTPTYRNFSPDEDSNYPYFDTGNDYQIGSINLTPTYTEIVGYYEAPSDIIVNIEVDFRFTGAYYETAIIIVDSSGNSAGSGGGQIDLNPNITFNQLYSYFNNRRINASVTAYMPSGSRAYVSMDASSNTVIHSGGLLRITELGSYGGVYKVINEDDSFISRTEFKRDIANETWRAIKADPFKRINGSYVDGDFSGFPLDIRRNILTGESDVKLYQRKSDVDG